MINPRKKMGRPSIPKNKRVTSKSFQFTQEQFKFIDEQGGPAWLRSVINDMMVGGSCNVTTK